MSPQHPVRTVVLSLKVETAVQVVQTRRYLN